MIVYMLTNLINSKKYIGQTRKSSKVRLAQHKCAKSYIGNALRKYGVDNFSLDVLLITSKEKSLDKWEKSFIKDYQTQYPNGYNMDAGGYKSKTTGRPAWNKGLKMSMEHRKKLSDAHKGQRNPLRKNIIGTNVSTGETIHLEGSTEGKALGFEPSLIRRCCRGVVRTHKGYHWRYK